MTGISRETVSKKLRGLPFEDGPRASKIYDTTVALPKLYVSDSEDVIDLTQARAKLATKQTQKIDLDMELRRGDYVVRSDVKDAIVAMLIAFRAKMLGIPTKAVPQLKVAKDGTEQEQILLELIHDALKELRDLDILQPGGDKPVGGVPSRARTPAKTNGK